MDVSHQFKVFQEEKEEAHGGGGGGWQRQAINHKRKKIEKNSKNGEI
jgi:hypothetical protein